MHNQFIFIGGSKEGLQAADSAEEVITFVNGCLVHPLADGSIDAPLNALIESYVRERVDEEHGGPFSAYFLGGMARDDRDQRLARVLKKHPRRAEAAD